MAHPGLHHTPRDCMYYDHVESYVNTHPLRPAPWLISIHFKLILKLIISLSSQISVDSSSQDFLVNRILCQQTAQDNGTSYVRNFIPQEGYEGMKKRCLWTGPYQLLPRHHPPGLLWSLYGGEKLHSLVRGLEEQGMIRSNFFSLNKFSVHCVLCHIAPVCHFLLCLCHSFFYDSSLIFGRIIIR